MKNQSQKHPKTWYFLMCRKVKCQLYEVKLNITVKVETKWRENGDNMGTKRRQNGDKMEANMETKWRQNGGLKTRLGKAGGRGQQKCIMEKT